MDLRPLGPDVLDPSRVRATVLAGDDVRATNTAERPDRVVPRRHDGVDVADGVLTVRMPAVSWVVTVGPGGRRG